jgi:uncharacterized protein (TIGR02145 family)
VVVILLGFEHKAAHLVAMFLYLLQPNSQTNKNFLMELTMNKTLLLLLLTFQLSYAQGVNNSTTLNLTDGVTVTVRGNYTHEANAVVNLEAGTVLSIVGSITDNGGSYSGDGEIYLNNVDVYGCTDSLALNYDENAEINDGSCYHDVVTDIDGNEYQAVQIGDQLWMKENLKVTHYNNGDEIPTGYSDNDWAGLSTGAYAVYDDNPSNAETYGNLYNWYAVDDNRIIAPEGWHIPTDDEWQVVVDYLGGAPVAGAKIKEEGTEHWNSPNIVATNESGFTAFGGGFRHRDSGNYDDNKEWGYFWSSTSNETNSGHAWSRVLASYNIAVQPGIFSTQRMEKPSFLSESPCCTAIL